MYQKLTIALALLLSTSVFADQWVSLPRTMSADSTQAILSDVLREAAADYSQIQPVAGGFVVQDRTARLRSHVWSSSGLATVMSYGADLWVQYGYRDHVAEITLTMDAASVAAVVHAAMEKDFNNNPYTQVKRSRTGYEISDGRSRLTSKVDGGGSSQPGMVGPAVMSYGLKLELLR